MEHPISIRFLLLAFLVSVAGVASFGQTAQVTGRVSDQAGAVVPGAQITVTNVDTGLSRESVTNNEGYFTIPPLKPGEYRIAVKKDGFKYGSGQFRHHGREPHQQGYFLRPARSSTDRESSPERALQLR